MAGIKIRPSQRGAIRVKGNWIAVGAAIIGLTALGVVGFAGTSTYGTATPAYLSSPVAPSHVAATVPDTTMDRGHS